jgi:hypothetical protein
MTPARVRNIIRASVLAASAALAGPATAGDFDGSRPLICAVAEARDCVSGVDCFGGLPGEFGAPAFIRIDFARKAIVGPKRTTPIVHQEKTPQQLLLQGTELGYAWALAIEQPSGRFSASLTNHDGAFVLFGACIVP